MQLDGPSHAIVETVRAPLLVLDDLRTAVKVLGRYWFEFVELPQEEDGA
ncbi:MAG: hypothetical protein WEA09_09835 [Gemmatimonadota bacterium]